MTTDMPEIVIRRCRADDLDTLGVVAPAAYAQAYGYLWDDPATYLRQLNTFSVAAFARLLDRESARVWIATVNGGIAGFALMNLAVPDPIRFADGGAELARIYVLGPARRAGLGPRLLEVAIAEAFAAGCSYVWLNVMSSANWARRAYDKWGFTEIGRMDYTGGVAVGMESMVVMARPIGTSTDLREVS